MKILIVMTGFFPGQKFGGPPVSVNNFCSLMNGHDCYIVTRNHDLGENNKPYTNIESGWNSRENCKVLYLTDKEYGYKQFGKIISELKPDIIYLQGLFQNCIIPCLILAKKHKIPVLLAPRGELCKGAFKKKYKKIPYILFLKMFGLINSTNFQSTSEEETEAIKKHLNIDSSRIWSLPNIPSIPNREYSHNRKEAGTARFIFLSRIVPKKNLDLALEFIANSKGNVEYDIFGSNEDETYWQKCKAIIQRLPSNIKVSYKGNIAHEKVQMTYARYDALLFPTKSENFGHAIVEALSVGCPVIISDQTPWIDLQEFDAGWSIELSNKNEFVKAIQCIIDNDEIAQDSMRKAAMHYFAIKMKLTELKKKYNTALEGSIKS